MKSLLRQKAKIIRNSLDSAKMSSLCVKLISTWDKFQNAKNIMIYCPINNEIDLMALTQCQDKKFYLPKIENNKICIAQYKGELACGMYNIKEPCNQSIQNTDILDLIFIPALQADKWGYRIGYGKGYYDRFLKSVNSKATTAVLVYEELFCEDVPIEAHDEKADFVITPSSIQETSIRLA